MGGAATVLYCGTCRQQTPLKSPHFQIISKYSTVCLALRCTHWLAVEIRTTYLSTVQNSHLSQERHMKKSFPNAQTSETRALLTTTAGSLSTQN